MESKIIGRGMTRSRCEDLVCRENESQEAEKEAGPCSERLGSASGHTRTVVLRLRSQVRSCTYVRMDVSLLAPLKSAPRALKLASTGAHFSCLPRRTWLEFGLWNGNYGNHDSRSAPLAAKAGARGEIKARTRGFHAGGNGGRMKFTRGHDMILAARI